MNECLIDEYGKFQSYNVSPKISIEIPQTCVEESEANFGAKQLLSALMWVQERCPLARFVAMTSGNVVYNYLFVHLLTGKVERGHSNNM